MCIKQYWNKYKAYIIASAIALAYLIGIKKGKDHEKIRQTKTVLCTSYSLQQVFVAVWLLAVFVLDNCFYQRKHGVIIKQV